MRITAITAKTIRWAITGEASARGRTERSAVLLEVRTDGGALGLGEAAPLPGMSIDTLAQAQAALAAWVDLAPFELVARGVADRRASSHADPYVPAERLPFEIVDDAAARAFASAPLAARFGIETALCDAMARERGMSLAALLRERIDPAGEDPRPAGEAVRVPTPRARAAPIGHAARTTATDASRVPLAAVIDDPDQARRAFAAGVRCFKIKLGTDDPLDRVVAISQAVPGATLRIDANGSWPPAEVLGRLAALADLAIDYVEEPCRDAHLLLRASLPRRLALDESLIAMSLDEVLAALRSPGLAALVLKPTLLGGLSVALELAMLARRFGVAAVASHALEGPIGTAACAELALALAEHATAAAGASRHVTPASRATGHVTPTSPTTPPAGLASHPALAGWGVRVDQLAVDHVHPVAAAGLGFAHFDLAAIVRSCRTRIGDEVRPP